MDEEVRNEEDISKEGNKSLWLWVLIFVLVGAIVLGGAYYFNKKMAFSNQVQAPQPTSPVQATPTTLTLPSKKIVMISGNEFAFTPSTITVNKGDMVELTFKNTGKFSHNLAIADLNVKTQTISGSEQDVISFVVDKVGSFKFTCTVPGHADKGMVGTLIVK